MKSNLNMLIYNNKEDLNYFPLPQDSTSKDLILLHHTYSTSHLAKDLNQLAKGILSPRKIDCEYPNSFLAQLRNSQTPIAIASPLVDNNAHNPYYKMLSRIDDLELEISQNFLNGEHYSNYELFSRVFQLYHFTFNYVFRYIKEQILQRAFLQSIGAWEQSGKDELNVLLVGNHNFLSYRLMCPPESEIKVSRPHLTNRHLSLSIRHEIIRRQLLDMPVTEQYYNGFTIERTIRLLETEITIPSHRSPIYNTRKTLCSLSDEQTINISSEIAQKQNIMHKIKHLTEL